MLDLLRTLHDANRMSMIFITHNMGVIAELAHEVVVMYLGTVVEQGEVVAIFDEPKHPYTRALLASIPGIGVEPKSRLEAIEGDGSRPPTAGRADVRSAAAARSSSPAPATRSSRRCTAPTAATRCAASSTRETRVVEPAVPEAELAGEATPWLTPTAPQPMIPAPKRLTCSPSAA